MSFTDFVTTVICAKTPTLSTIGGIVTVLSTILGFIYSSKSAIVLLLVLMIIDWITGIIKSVKNKSFNSFTFQRMLINITFTIIIITLAYQLSIVLPLISWVKLPEFIFGGFAVTYFFSILENIHEIDKHIIPKKMYFYIKKMVSIDLLIPELFKIRNPKINTEFDDENEKEKEELEKDIK